MIDYDSTTLGSFALGYETRKFQNQATLLAKWSDFGPKVGSKFRILKIWSDANVAPFLPILNSPLAKEYST